MNDHPERPVSAAENAAFAKAAKYLIPFLFLLYVLAHIDRGNIGVVAAMAKGEFAQMGLVAEVLGFGMGIFYLGYSLFEVPSNLILQRVGARRWIARIMISWGLVATAMMFIQGPLSFYTYRFLLGVAEAGFMPGVILYLTLWFPAERRAKAVAWFLTSITAAIVITAPLTGYLIGLDGAMGLKGWQWVFLLQGIPSVLVGLLVLRVLPDGPRDARWLSNEERRMITARLEAEQAVAAARGPQPTFVQALAEPRLWLLVGLYFLLMTGFYGVNNWMPTFWKEMPGLKGLSNINLGWILTIPYLITAVVMVLVSRHSDRVGERRWHATVSAGIAALALAAAGIHQGNMWFTLICLTITCLGTFSALGPFWSLTTEYLKGSSAAGGIALVNGLGCLGGFAGPHLVPVLAPSPEKASFFADLTRQYGFNFAYLGLSLFLALFAMLILLVRPRLKA